MEEDEGAAGAEEEAATEPASSTKHCADAQYWQEGQLRERSSFLDVENRGTSLWLKRKHMAYLIFHICEGSGALGPTSAASRMRSEAGAWLSTAALHAATVIPLQNGLPSTDSSWRWVSCLRKGTQGVGGWAGPQGSIRCRLVGGGQAPGQGSRATSSLPDSGELLGRRQPVLREEQAHQLGGEKRPVWAYRRGG